MSADAAIGALAGGLLMAFLAPRGSRNTWAATGAVVAGAGGAAGATESQESILKRCLAGRGYSVLY